MDTTTHASLPADYPFKPEWEVVPQDVHERRQRGDDLLILDVRTDQEVEISRIPGAMHVPMQEVGARIDELMEHAERPVVVYCHHGRRSLIVTAALRRAGFADARSMAGGIDFWSRLIDSSVPVY